LFLPKNTRSLCTLGRRSMGKLGSKSSAMASMDRSTGPSRDSWNAARSDTSAALVVTSRTARCSTKKLK
jgi:hypothetical protein